MLLCVQLRRRSWMSPSAILGIEVVALFENLRAMSDSSAMPLAAPSAVLVGTVS